MPVLTITNKNFEKEVLNSNKLVIADFNANWCGPCRMLGPILEEVAKEKKEIKFVSINVDDNQTLAEKYQVTSIPCLIIFKDGNEIKRSVGLLSKEDLESFIGE